MDIKEAYIQNFTVFKDIHLEFSKGINIMVGTNGTGKTHMLKCLYAVCESVNSKSEDIYQISRPYFSVNAMELVRDKKIEMNVRK